MRILILVCAVFLYLADVVSAQSLIGSKVLRQFVEPNTAYCEVFVNSSDTVTWDINLETVFGGAAQGNYYAVYRRMMIMYPDSAGDGKCDSTAVKLLLSPAWGMDSLSGGTPSLGRQLFVCATKVVIDTANYIHTAGTRDSVVVDGTDRNKAGKHKNIQKLLYDASLYDNIIDGYDSLMTGTKTLTNHHKSQIYAHNFARIYFVGDSLNGKRKQDYVMPLDSSGGTLVKFILYGTAGDAGTPMPAVPELIRSGRRQ